jgi:hypothetical protein
MTPNRLTTIAFRWSFYAAFALWVFAPVVHVQRATATAISGVYNGTYTCAIGPRTLKLSLLASANGTLTGIFTFYLPPTSHTQAFSYRLSGTVDPVSGKFKLNPVRWETRPPGNYVMVGMDGGFDAGTGQVTGKITLGNCGTFQATRDVAESTNIGNVLAGPGATPAAQPPMQGAPQTVAPAVPASGRRGAGNRPPPPASAPSPAVPPAAAPSPTVAQTRPAAPVPPTAASGSSQSSKGGDQSECKCPSASRLQPGIELVLGATRSPYTIGSEDYPCSLENVVFLCPSWVPSLDSKNGDPSFGQKLKDLRKTFWDLYPPARGSVAAARVAKELDEWLFFKDVLNVKFALFILSGVRQGRRPQDNPNDLRSAMGPNELIGAVNLGTVLTGDAGIPQSAGPEFYDWAMAVLEKLGRPKSTDDFARFGWQTSFGGSDLQKAMEASRKQYRAYVTARNRAEFDAAGRVPAGAGLDHYVAQLYLRDAEITAPEASLAYCTAKDLLGTKVVEEAADKVSTAPKRPDGTLVTTVRPPIRIGPGGSQVDDESVAVPRGVIGVYRGPLAAFEKLVTGVDDPVESTDADRRYLLGLLSELNRNPRRFVRATEWCFAEGMYDRYKIAFDEAALLKASNAVRTAQKRLTDGWVMNPKAIGSTRLTPYSAFQDILARTEPKGYVRSLLAFGQNLDADGVKSAYAALTAKHGEAAVLNAARKIAAGRPNLTGKEDLDALMNILSGAAPAPGDTPAIAQISDPKYLAWKDFGPGAKATYVHRGLAPARPGDTQLVPGAATVRSTYTLQSITSDMAKLWLTEVVYDYPSGQAHPPHDTEIYYGGTMPPPRPSADTPLGSGDEMLTIAGRTIATHREAVRRPGRGCDTVVTTWTSDQVPGGLVRQLEDGNCQGRRIIRETLLELFAGSPTGTGK